MTNIPRPEHPKPQFQRDSWLNLNGPWAFEPDLSDSGTDRGLADPNATYSRTIQVPFCPESKLSGIEHKDFMAAVWYKRTVTLTPDQLSGRVLLHFGAVDYQAFVYVNGTLCGRHKGGYSSFCVDITDHVTPGENTITLRATDDTRDPMIPSGKQCHLYQSRACYYTRTTGIWQTVWLEFVPHTHIQKVRYQTDIHTATLTLTAWLAGPDTLTARALYEGRPVGQACVTCPGGMVTLTLPLSETHLWEPGHGRLYNLELTYGPDKVSSYFGLRSVWLDGRKFRINERSVFQRLILDQGFYPDGIYTAPTEADLERDIHLSLDMGFNGARLHEKVFEERFLYHCDRLGYLVWGEYPNWGLDHTRPESVYAILPEWLEVVDRDFNHPSIIAWCPLNETWDKFGRRQYDPMIAAVYRATRAADPTRPCLDTSGSTHVITDIFDIHDYEQDPALFAQTYAQLDREGALDFGNKSVPMQHYDGSKPLFVSEYGGIRWPEGKPEGWAYGKDPVNRQEYLERFQGLANVLLDNEYIFGFCYTQLTDVEQEQNGLYTYQRGIKCPPESIRPILSRRAAIED